MKMASKAARATRKRAERWLICVVCGTGYSEGYCPGIHNRRVGGMCGDASDLWGDVAYSRYCPGRLVRESTFRALQTDLGVAVPQPPLAAILLEGARIERLSADPMGAWLVDGTVPAGVHPASLRRPWPEEVNA